MKLFLIAQSFLFKIGLFWLFFSVFIFNFAKFHDQLESDSIYSPTLGTSIYPMLETCCSSSMVISERWRDEIHHPLSQSFFLWVLEPSPGDGKHWLVFDQFCRWQRWHRRSCRSSQRWFCHAFCRRPSQRRQDVYEGERVSSTEISWKTATSKRRLASFAIWQKESEIWSYSLVRSSKLGDKKGSHPWAPRKRIRKPLREAKRSHLLGEPHWEVIIPVKKSVINNSMITNA